MKKKHMGMGMGMGMMGMGKPIPTPTPTPTPSPNPANANPILLLNSFPALVETSIVDQDTTILPIKTSGQISRHFQALPQSNFTFVVNILLYAPNAVVDPIAVFDSSVANDTGNTGHNRLYNNVFQYGFGKNLNAYQHSMFYLNGVAPFSGTLYITVKHPLCKRRIVTVDQFANMSLGESIDKLSARQSPSQGTVQITSGLTDTTSSPFELVYGSIAVGREFDQFNEPQDFIPIQNVGSNIDAFDATLKTYYKLTSQTGQYGISALASTTSGLGNFVWSAAAQSFRAIAL